MNLIRTLTFSTSAALALSGCGAPSSGSGAGVGAGTRTTVVSAPVSGSERAAPGLYKTSGGVPWMVYESRARSRGRGALPQTLAMKEAAMRGPFDASNTVVIENAGSKAQFRIVTVDGHTFGVLKRLNTPGLYSTPEARSKASAGLLTKGLRVANCRPSGPSGDYWKGYNVHIAGVVPADC